MAPVSAAEGQWKRRALLKENGKYDDYKKKEMQLARNATNKVRKFLPYSSSKQRAVEKT